MELSGAPGAARPRSARGGGAGAPASWSLIWCHERCHKQECEGKRGHIGDTAKGLGAALVCFRKAAKFAAWASRAGPAPYGLLTDWKEAKPCLEAAGACALGARPAFLVIHAETAKCRERATAWAEAQPAWATPTRILADLGLLRLCLHGLVGGGAAPQGGPGLATPCGRRALGQLSAWRLPQYVGTADCWPSAVRAGFRELKLAEALALEAPGPALAGKPSIPPSGELESLPMQIDALQQQVAKPKSDLATHARGDQSPAEHNNHGGPVPPATGLTLAESLRRWPPAGMSSAS